MERSTKIDIKICCGTHCYIMGGADLLLLEQKLPETLKSNIRIKGETCYMFCKESTSAQHPPYVKIGDTILPNATVDKIINHLKNTHHDLF